MRCKCESLHSLLFGKEGLYVSISKFEIASRDKRGKPDHDKAFIRNFLGRDNYDSDGFYASLMNWIKKP